MTQRDRRHAVWLALIIGLFLAFGTSIATPHEIRPTIATLEISGDGAIELSLSVNLEALIAAIGPQHEDSNNSPNAGEYNRLRDLAPAELSSAYQLFARELLAGLSLTDPDGNRVPLSQSDISIPNVGDTSVQRTSLVTFTGNVPSGVKALRWRFGDAFGASAIRAKPVDGEIFFSDYVLAGETSGDISLGTVVRQTKPSIFLDYLDIGFEHIVPKGLDHILFVVGLFLLSPRIKPILWQITCFTLAHSVTLCLGALGLVQAPDWIVQPMVALSIVYVAVENVWTQKLSRWRPLVVFLFGLLHGLGFASVLTEVGLVGGDFVVGLVAFNVGVELGQLAIVAACFFTIGLWFGEKPWYRRVVTIPASLAIAAVGAFWFIERVG